MTISADVSLRVFVRDEQDNVWLAFDVASEYIKQLAIEHVLHYSPREVMRCQLTGKRVHLKDGELEKLLGVDALPEPVV
jgi:hypothetical protein